MNKLLIVVDYQKDFVDGSLGNPAAAALDGNICAKIRQYRREGGRIVFTFDTHGEDYLSTQEGRNLPVPHCVQGTPGWMLYGETAREIRPEDLSFSKPCFGSMALAEYLKRSGFDQVELVGVVTDICVLSNAVLAKAALPEALVSVDAACVAATSPEMQEKTFDVMASLQIQVTNRN